jgi:DNA-binding SARP family transcriptional activator/TolB-like protein
LETTAVQSCTFGVPLPTSLMQLASKAFELRLLGPTEIRVSVSSHTVVLPPKRIALLAYLAVETSDGYRRRDQVATLFWPELPQDAARTQLRKSIAALRDALGQNVVQNRGEGELRLDPEQLWCDAVALAKLMADGKPAEALVLYRGEFLEGLFPEGVGQEFHDWASAKRNAIRDIAAAAAWACARIEEDRGDRKAAAAMARKALELTPDDEEGVRRLIAILDRHGDRAGALRVYSDWQQRLQSEYGVEPAPETRKLVRKVQAARKGESHETPPTAPALTSYLTQPPLVRDVRNSWWSPRRVIVGLVASGILTIGIAAIARRPAPLPDSIAVLPLQGLATSHVVMRGLTEEILTALAQSRFSVHALPGEYDDAQQLWWAKGLRSAVAHVVDGGVQQGNGQLRVTVRLVRTKDGIVQWAGSYDLADPANISAIKNVAADAVRSIRVSVRTD